ncbi:MAG TPA: hypothetical protein VGO91_12690 [Pyrinomonadaceae bacterium]|nr:hypothetical protein [Pyrinomonadaceae bacterium]
MNISKSFALASLALTLGLASALTVASASGLENARPIPNAAAQQSTSSTSALERGYRTGYSDGFQSGYADSTDNAARDYRNKDDYRRADRAYAASYGRVEDYRDGYRQGFEVGYSAGYEHRGFDSTVPSGLSRSQNSADKPDADTEPVNTNDNNGSTNTTADNSSSNSQNNPDNNANANAGISTNSSGPITIPADTVMRVELLNGLSTDASQRGDKFQARVIEPQEYQGAIIDGRVTSVKRAGKIKGKSELQLSIEQIHLADNRWANMSGQVIEVVYPNGTGTADVDPEGGVKGKDKTKDDVSTVAASTGVGAIIGAIVGGGKGAAIGAAIGGGIGTGRVLTSSGGDIHLERGQQLRIRTSGETRIQ